MNELMDYILQVLEEPIVWGVGLLSIWLKGVLNPYAPSPQRTFLGAQNFVKKVWRKVWRYVRPQPPLSGARFHVVLSWLESDDSGESTRFVEGAFQNIAGISLSRSARIVKASGAKDDWEPAMRKRAHEILADWQADLAIVGKVKDAKKVLSLWFVPGVGDGTLSRGDTSNYQLENVTLGDDFHKEFRAQLAAMVLSAVAPLVSDEARGKALDDGLNMVSEQLDTLLGNENSPIVDPDRRAGLYMALGNALLTLGERESSTGRLEQAVAAYKAALEERTRDRVPLDWAATQNNLGAALSNLGKRESGPERLEQAVAAYNAALEEHTRERVPLNWATTQNNLGTVLQALGERESGPERLEQAVAAYKAALEERTRDRVPLELGRDAEQPWCNALQTLGERESGPERLEQAVAAYNAALEECTRERVPFNWAMTQNNLGNALQTLGERESGPERLEQAVAAYNAALEECTRERVPFNWAMTQNNLGNALQNLGERESGPERLEQAVAAYNAALEERTRECVPLNWAITQNNLGAALQTLGERESGPERLEQAVAAYNAALEVFTPDQTPQYWNMAQDYLHRALEALNKRRTES